MNDSLPHPSTRRAILLAAAALLVFPCHRSGADPIPTDFQAKNSGCQAGTLHGQNGWNVRVQAPANSGFTVVPGTGLELTPNTGGTHAVAYAFINDKETLVGRDNFPGGMPLSLAVNFVIKWTGPAAKAPILGVGWGLYVPVDMNNLPFAAELVRDSGQGGYRLVLFRQGDKTEVTGETSVAIPEEALGFKDSGFSDPLQLSFTLTNQGTPHEWSSVSMLTNLATKKVFVLRNTMVAPEVYKTDDLVRAIVNRRRFSEDGLDSVTIIKLDDEVTPDPSAQ